MNVAIVTVGNELLAGRTTDTNAAWLCERLTERGVRVERVTTVPDRIPDIAEVVGAHRNVYDAVVVTGGLGPTHDDVTMAGVATALDRPLERDETVGAWLAERGGYDRNELTAGTDELPAGARPLHNEVGVAPGAVVENVYVLPGVPVEMKAMFESVESAFDGERRYRATVVAAEPESALLDRIERLRAQFDVGVGCYPGETVRVELEGEDQAVVEEAANWLEARVTPPSDRGR